MTSRLPYSRGNSHPTIRYGGRVLNTARLVVMALIAALLAIVSGVVVRRER